MKSDVPLSADFLFQGAFCAAAQAGNLLHDAVHLYNLARFSSATVLAVYSREEVGRSRILLGMRKRVLAGGVVRSDAKFHKQFRDHVRKLEAGQFFVDVELPDRELREIPAEEIGRPRYHPEDVAFYEETARRVKKARKERAHIFHEQRMNALHVDLSEDSSSWNQPHKIHPGWVSMLLHYLCVDYIQLHRDVSETGEGGVLSSPKEWADRPILPQPIYVPWKDDGDGTEVGPITSIE
jgi:AbiV family abortive infection protein